MTEPRRRDLWCVALLVGVATIFLLDVFVAGSNFFARDLYVYHFPMKRVVREAILSGEFPFWNRYFSGGQPLAANPAYELFYPMQLLILIGSYEFGFAMHIVAHIYAALIGMFLLLRQLRLQRPAAMLGSLSFGMGGLLLGSLPTLPTFFVWALAPLVAWTVVRALQAPGPSRIAVAVLLAGVQMSIGEPLSLAQVWLLIGAGAAFAGRTSPSVRAAALAAGIAIGAVAVAAVQLIPAADHAGDSARARGLPFTLVREFALPPLRPAELIIPHLYGILDPTAPMFWGSSAFDRRGPYLTSIYAGVFVPIFVLAGWMLRLPGSRTTAALALLSYVLAVGDRTPLLRALYTVGILRGVRYPEKFIAFGVVGLIIFAAFACDHLLSGDRRAWRAAMIAGGIVFVVAAVPVIWSLMPGYVGAFVRIWGLRPERAGLALVARSVWSIGLVVTTAAIALIFAARRGAGRTILLLTGLVLAVDLLWFGNEVLARMPQPFFDPPAIVKELTGDPSAFAIFHRGEWLHGDVNRRRFLARSGTWTSRNALPPFTPALWGFRSVLELDFDETALLPTHDLLESMMALGNSGFDRWAEPFATISNVRYVLAYRDFEEDGKESGGNPLRSKPVTATRLAEQPRYYFATMLRRAQTRDEALAFFRTNPRPYGVALVRFEPPEVAPGRVLRVDERPSSATIDVETTGPAFLVATVTRHKYWTATVDGRAATLVPANIAYQGLRVPAGRHRVEMRYRNPVVLWSGILSTVATLAALITILRRPRPRLQSES